MARIIAYLIRIKTFKLKLALKSYKAPKLSIHITHRRFAVTDTMCGSP